MKYRLMLLFVLGCIPLLGTKAKDAPIPLEDFFGLPNVAQPRLSPDGNMIAFLAPIDGKMALAIFDLRTGEAREVIHGKDEGLKTFFWKGNDHLVFEADVGGNESYFVGTTDLSGENRMRLNESYDAGIGWELKDILRFDPTNIIMGGLYGSSYRLMLVGAVSGDMDVYFTCDDDYVNSLLDNAGRVRLIMTHLGHKATWKLRGAQGKGFDAIVSEKYHGIFEDWEPLFFAANNETLYVISRQKYDQGALYAYNTRTRKMGEPVFVPPEGEITKVITSYDRSKLYGVAYETDKEEYHWFDPVEADIYAKLKKSFPGELVDVVSRCADEHLEIVYVHSDRDPGAYYILDRRRGGLILFKRVRNLDPRRMQPMQPIAFKARDGLVLHGYLTLPADAKGRRVPLVIHPHGGPYGIRDSWDFDPEVQFLASRGYAVLQVNFRGSGGYGRKFIDAGRYQWGRAMQDDLTDAVHWAMAQGIADPKRVAIYGASYGGYAALAGVTLTPDLYCCAVNYLGPTDLNLLFSSINWIYQWFDFQKEWIGKNSEDRKAVSPLLFVDRIRVPTLNAYGDKDPRVKIKSWDRFEAQLKKYHKNYTAIEEEHQGHGFDHVSAALHFYATMEKFLAEYLAPERSAVDDGKAAK